MQRKVPVYKNLDGFNDLVAGVDDLAAGFDDLALRVLLALEPV